MNSKKERMLICSLLTGELSMRDFAEISEVTSANGLLIVELVRHLLAKYDDRIPACYKNFISNVCKLTSARGLLQVLTPQPLEYLEQFCKKQLNLRLHSSQEKLLCVASNFPALWPDIDSMCNMEKSIFMPKAVSDIVLKMLEIR